ncbi:MAG TPA: right-handed parallel beta-helix repeat-containing protein, partial [Planctomycetes bacterium]|nr:right-handed parallel beta-helix repeat-containing protein [Planctomycetota bacterium]
MTRFSCFLLAFILLLAGCGRFTPPVEPIPTEVTPPDGDGVGSSSQNVFEYPLFGGIDDLLAGDGWVRIGWETASDNDFEPEELSYRVYLALDSGHQDFSIPDLEISSDSNVAFIEGLANGTAIHAVVRAVDPLGNEDPNEVEWAATPNPVRYVNHATSPVGGNGLTPETAFSSMGQAVGESIPLEGVNFHVSAGLYLENVFLFSGMFLYGGFDASFAPDARNGELNLTQFASLFSTDLVILSPGHLLTGIDSISLSGQGIVESGVVAVETWARITNCQIFDVTIHGVEFRSDFFDGDTVDGTLRGCVIEGCGGEGVVIDGIGNILIDNNQIRSNLNEGIESQWIRSGFEQESRIEITRNIIRDNGDEGIDLDCA